MLRDLAIAAVTGIGVGIAVAVHFYAAPRLEAAQLRIDTLSRDVNDQNDALEELRDERAKRAKAAAAAVDAAASAARPREANAQRILSQPKPAGQDDCQALEALMRKELGK